MKKICIFSSHVEQKPYTGSSNYSKLTFKNFQRYAEYYGYDFILNTVPNEKYFINNGYDDSRNNLYPYVYQIYKIYQLLSIYEKVFFIASDMLITKQFKSLQQQFGDVDYASDKNLYQTAYLRKLLDLSNWDNQTKLKIRKKLINREVQYFFPNSFLISKNIRELYNFEKFKSVFGHMTNREIGFPFSNNELQLLIFLNFKEKNDFQFFSPIKPNQYHYDVEVRKYWKNFNMYPHQKILSDNKLLLFCGCGSYGPYYMIRTKLIYDIVKKHKELIW